jgi:hypothetical protein
MACTPRAPKSGQYRPWASEPQKRLWRDPEHRAKMCQARARTAEDRRKRPERYSRLGVPNGMHRAEADAAWEAAAALAGNAMAGLEAQGLVPVDVLPNSDEALAKAALHEVALLALGPTNRRTKMQALNILLAFTKAKPAERRAISKANNPTDEWMQSVLQADSQPAAFITSARPTAFHERRSLRQSS